MKTDGQPVSAPETIWQAANTVCGYIPIAQLNFPNPYAVPANAPVAQLPDPRVTFPMLLFDNLGYANNPSPNDLARCWITGAAVHL